MHNHLPHPEVVSKVVAALKANGINASLAQNGEDAKAKVLALIPEGAEVMTMTSVTTDTLGISQELNESGRYNPVRHKLYDKHTDPKVKRQLGAAADYVVGSVHAVTEDGHVLIASNTGSQLPGYAYAGGKVIWVVGVQKIVKDFNDGLKRIYDHVLPLESDRARKAYGTSGSNVSKLLVVNKEVNPDRLTLIFVPEAIGF
jgi:hypothetical protein